MLASEMNRDVVARIVPQTMSTLKTASFSQDKEDNKEPYQRRVII